MKTTTRNVQCAWGCLLLLMLSALPGVSQHIDTRIPFSGHPWRFNDTGTDLGTAWSTNDFDDSAWPVGNGLFGVETNAPFPYLPTFSQITTPMLLNQSGIVTTTFYFRTWFTMDASNFAPYTVIVATNFIDDGAVLYLNGTEVGRFRVASNQTFTTGASFLQTEGTNEVLFIDTNLFRIGSNLLAVELHQNAFPSSDIVWGHTLMAIGPTPLTITSQPASQIKVASDTVTFSVGMSGTPATYYWQKESSPGSGVWGLPNPAPMNQNTYTIPILQTSHAGNYRVIVSNIVNTVTSIVAQLTVYPDNVGPRALRAEPSLLAGITNRIAVYYSELMNGTLATTPSNFNISLLGTTDTVSIVSAIYSGSGPVSILKLNASNFHLEPTNRYVVTINNLRDLAGNIIAPNTQVPVWWTNLVAGAETWPLPPEPIPVLQTTSLDTNLYRLSWTGHGYALESTTNLSPAPGLPAFLAWPEVTNMSNPFLYTNKPVGPSRFFRLRK